MNIKDKKGFTLIELLIVIGIIAILAAAVIIAINPGQQFEQARNATRWSHMNSIVNSVYSYTITEGGSYPDCIASPGSPDADGFVDAGMCAEDLEGYMSAIPGDPEAGSEVTTGAGNNASDSCYAIKLENNRVTVKPYVSSCNINDDVAEVEVVQ